jgi:hypothetical protein
MRSFGESQRFFIRHLSTEAIIIECLHGPLFSATIVFICLYATSFSNYFRHLRELGGQDAKREDEGDINGVLQVHNILITPRRGRSRKIHLTRKKKRTLMMTIKMVKNRSMSREKEKIQGPETDQPSKNLPMLSFRIFGIGDRH